MHGAGNYVLGRKTTAARLLQLEGLAIGLAGLGAGLLFVSGSARDFVGPGAALALAGAGLFSVSFAADLYSVSAPAGGLGRDPGWVPVFESELGYRYVFDPHLDYRNFVVSGLTGRFGRLRISPSLWSAPENANQLAGVEVAYRLLGPVPNSHCNDGSFVDIASAFSEHRFGFESFGLTIGEASVEGRWDLVEYDPNPAGAFVDYQIGAATQLYHWESSPDDDISSTILLARFGFGVYLGDRTPRGGYVRAYYDHRNDGIAGGVLATGLGTGAGGHFGLEGHYYFTEHWGALVDTQVGSALVVGASGLFRFGGVE